MFTRKGQVIVEYLIIFVIFALITLLSLSVFYPKVKSTGENLFTEATERIVK